MLAVLTFYGLIGAVAVATERGMGTHITLILYEHGFQGVIDYSQVSRVLASIPATPMCSPRSIQNADTGKAIFVCAVFYNTVLGMVKLSVLCLYLRIIRGVQSQSVRFLVWSVFVIVASNTLANVTVAIFQCWPIKAAWDVTIAPDQKRCVHFHKRS